ncbi:MAG TPA: hypothetical protein VGU03_15320 [Frateuria sp.]|uniref:hypothetical protein n=1 Tax=Frateuria sp. TaxID=2211372 RepID=UPI002DE20B40|nr:hypothetical protein [Frateuria sp.]
MKYPLAPMAWAMSVVEWLSHAGSSVPSTARFPGRYPTLTVAAGQAFAIRLQWFGLARAGTPRQPAFSTLMALRHQTSLVP